MIAAADRGDMRRGTNYNNAERVRSEGWGRWRDTVIEIVKVISG